MKQDHRNGRELSVIQECAATNCTFNENHICEAGEIEVEPTDRGPICATFEPDADAQQSGAAMS